jgi:hypothetical protein
MPSAYLDIVGTKVVSSRPVPPEYRPVAPEPVTGLALLDSTEDWHIPVSETSPAEMHLLLLHKDLAAS